MSKSVLTILVIGFVGAILMSLGMKHLVEVKNDRDRSPYCAAVESRLGAKRMGPVTIREVKDGEKVTLVVEATVLAGLDKQRLADSAGLEVWLGALRKGARVDAVQVVLDDDDGGEPETFAIASPTTKGTSTGGTPASRGAKPASPKKPAQPKTVPPAPSGGARK